MGVLYIIPKYLEKVNVSGLIGIDFSWNYTITIILLVKMIGNYYVEL